MSEELNAIQAEIAASESLPETNQPHEETLASEGVKTQEQSVESEAKTVPYTRFKEVNDKLKMYQELAGLRKPKEEHVESNKASEDILDDQNDVRKVAREEAAKVSQNTIKMANDAFELQAVMQNKDFAELYPKIKEAVSENPHLSWQQAYKLARFDSLEQESYERGKQAAYGKIDEKKQSAVESPKKAVAPKQFQSIDPMDKSISLNELRDMLPRA